MKEKWKMTQWREMMKNRKYDIKQWNINLRNEWLCLYDLV